MYVQERARALCLRAEAGYQGGLMLSTGVSRFWARPGKGAGLSAYAAGQVILGSQQPCYGWKAGLEGNFFIFYGGGIELKYLANPGGNSLMLMPKAGLSLLNLFNLHYGYNFYLEDQGLQSRLGHHQIGLSVNYARRVWFDKYLSDD